VKFGASERPIAALIGRPAVARDSLDDEPQLGARAARSLKGGVGSRSSIAIPF